MTIEAISAERTEGEAPWLWPLYALLAVIAAILDHIPKLKRIRPTTKFKPNWRDSWQDLRQGEWLRDQVIAHGLASLLEGRELDLNASLIMDPPDDYGGPCPKTPFAMNQRFLALARWTSNPEAIIRERYKRLVKRFGANSLASHGSTDAALRAAAHHELVGVAPPENTKATKAQLALILSSARSARPSKDERVLPAARGPPPNCLHPIPHSLSAPRLRTPPLAPHPEQAYPPLMTTRAALLQLKRKAICLAPARR